MWPLLTVSRARSAHLFQASMRCQVVVSLAGSCRTPRGKWARATPVLVVQKVGSRPTRPSRVRRPASRGSGGAVCSGVGVGAASLTAATDSLSASTGGGAGTRSGGRSHGSGNGGKDENRSRSGIDKNAFNQIHTGHVKQKRLQ